MTYKLAILLLAALPPLVAQMGVVIGGSLSGIPSDSSYGNTITGKPYSAEEITEQSQTLADGTHITACVCKGSFTEIRQEERGLSSLSDP